MRSFVKRMIGRAVRNDTVWAGLDATVVRAAEHARWSRSLEEESPGGIRLGHDEAARAISPELVVKYGPFRGMRYPEPASVGSLFLPKLLGTYERELQPLVEALCGRQYSEVVDVGCAEGYYAVGMALRIPTAKVFAFDINAEALRLCESMARLNGVSDRLVAGSFCDPAALKSLPLTRRALIICDCEGYETTLLCDDVVPLLVNHDLLIEVHDCIDPAISSILRQRFSNTHRVMAVQSVGDETMALTYGYEEILGYDLETRKMILAEGRWGVMEWFYLTPRSSARL